MTLRDIISFLGLEVDERRLKVRTVINLNKNDLLAGTAFPNIFLNLSFIDSVASKSSYSLITIMKKLHCAKV